MISDTAVVVAALLPAALLLTATGSAQEPGATKAAEPAAGATTDDRVATLADALRRAHRPGGGAIDVRTFSGNLRITSSRPGADKIEVRIAVRFRLKEPLIRYRIEEGGKVIQRGRDTKGMWVQIDEDEPPVAATGRAYKDDLKALRRDLRLARQIVQFLDPATFVHRLKNAAVGEAPFGKVRCRTIVGVVDDYPLYTTAGQTRRARIKLWIDPADHLLAVEARPLDAVADGQPPPPAEMVIMPRHVEQDGLLLPPELRFFRIAAGKPVPEAVVVIETLAINPPLATDKFARQQPW